MHITTQHRSPDKGRFLCLLKGRVGGEGVLDAFKLNEINEYVPLHSCCAVIRLGPIIQKMFGRGHAMLSGQAYSQEVGAGPRPGGQHACTPLLLQVPCSRHTQMARDRRLVGQSFWSSFESIRLLAPPLFGSRKICCCLSLGAHVTFLLAPVLAVYGGVGKLMHKTHTLS